MRIKAVMLIAAALLLAFGLAACGGDDDGGDGGDGGDGLGDEVADVDLSGQSYTVGSKEFTEQLILGQMTVQMLEAAGADVADETGLEGSVAARRALESGEIDMYWEYTGTAWLTYLQEDEPILDSEQQYEEVAQTDSSQNQIEWLEPTPFDNTYAIAAREDAGGEVDAVETLSDLTELAESDPDQATMCVGQEFASREDGLQVLTQGYGLDVPGDNVSNVGDAVVYDQVGQGACNFGSVFATDGKIAPNNLRVLEDDQQNFAVYNAALNVRDQALEQAPDLPELFDPLAASLDTETMQGLNTQVDEEGERPDDVARSYLEENGFLAG